MEDLAEAICQVAERDEFSCPIQRRVKNNMTIFNMFKECNCCEEHSHRKPVDISDRRGGQRFPDGDLRNLTGTHEDVAEDERIDTMADRHPRVLTFLNAQRCTCPCRFLMRKIAVDVTTEACKRVLQPLRDEQKGKCQFIRPPNMDEMVGVMNAN